MKLVGSSQQQVHHYMYDVSGSVTTGGTAQLVMCQAPARSYLYLQNNSNGPLWFEFGSARATATLTAGVVTSCSVTNAGMGFTNPPVVRFFGGGASNGVGAPFLGGNLPGYGSPSNVATGHAVMTGSAPNKTLSSITVDNGGARYLCAPYVFLFNSDLDPYGCAVPSAGVGIQLQAGAELMFNGTVCPTDSIAVFGATTAQKFVAKFLD